MKKSVKLLSIMLIVIMCAFMFAGCAAEPEYGDGADKVEFVITEAAIERELENFLDGRDDRTSFSAGESAAAMYLHDRLIDMGYEEGEESMIRPFKTSVTVGTGFSSSKKIDLESRNVVATYRPDNIPANAKNVIVGAYYDNIYATPYEGSDIRGTKAAGAMSNGTGVAAALAVADYLATEKPELDFTVTFVFFGASATSIIGAEKYYEEQMTAAEKTNTVLMIELQRLGGDYIYAFSDERETEREDFFDGIAEGAGLNAYMKKTSQKSPIMTSVYSLPGIPYHRWAMSGLFSVFFKHNIPTLNLVSADWETLDLTDRESANAGSVSFTSADTLENLEENFAGYAKRTAIAASLVAASFADKNFVSVMTSDRENFPDTDVLTKNWIWYLVVIGVILIGWGVMTIAVSRLAKKYPVVQKRPREMKMAVFGMDYEDKEPGKIYVDIRPAAKEDDIFPGVPNNDPSVAPQTPPVTAADPQHEERDKNDSDGDGKE